jgi:hypothetical protein
LLDDRRIRIRILNIAFNQAYQTRDNTPRGKREDSARRARKLGQYSQKLHMLQKRHISNRKSGDLKYELA